MGITSGAYKFLVVLHLMTVIVGFGSVFLSGVFGAKAMARGGREGLAVGEVTYEVARNWSEWFIYAVPITGILLVMVSDDVWKFSHAWISLGFLLYIVALGITHALHLPNIRRINQLAGELAAGAPPPDGGTGGPPPQVAELEARGRRAGAIGAILNLIVVAVVFLMVWKPGV